MDLQRNSEGRINRVRDKRDVWRRSSPPNRTRWSPATWPGTPAPLEAGPLSQCALPLVFRCLLSNSEDISILRASVLQMLLPFCWGCLFHLSFFFFFFSFFFRTLFFKLIFIYLSCDVFYGLWGANWAGCEASSKTRFTDTVRTLPRTRHERPQSV